MRTTHIDDSFMKAGLKQKNPGKRVLRTGIVFDRPDEYQNIAGPADRFAEFEPESTIEAMEQAVLLSGHVPVRIGSPARLLDNAPKVDVIWNIGEGYGTRNREAWTPVICEMLGIPYLGSDAFALSVTLDKVLAKQIAQQLDIPTTPSQVIPFGNNHKKADRITLKEGYPVPEASGSAVSCPEKEIPLPKPIHPYPLFLKPRYEGTSKGISIQSIVRNDSAFEKQCRYLLETYRQDVLAEPFLSGPEITCALAYHPLQALPVLERGLHPSGIGTHAVAGGTAAHAGTLSQAETGEFPETACKRFIHAGDESSIPDSNTEKPSATDDGTVDAGAITLKDEATVSGAITPQLEADLVSWSLAFCKWLDIRDFVRMDFKLDSDGNPIFLEANPLPTFGTDSTFAILAEINGITYPEFLSGILNAALQRLDL